MKIAMSSPDAMRLDARAVELPLDVRGLERSSPAATSPAVCASIGPIGAQRCQPEAREPVAALAHRDLCDRRRGSPASIAARRTSATGTPAAFATASAITPSSAPCRSSPRNSPTSRRCSGSVARAKSAASSSRRAAWEPWPGDGLQARHGRVDLEQLERRLRRRRGQLAQRRPPHADGSLRQLPRQVRDRDGDLLGLQPRGGTRRAARPSRAATTSPRRQPTSCAIARAASPTFKPLGSESQTSAPPSAHSPPVPCLRAHARSRRRSRARGPAPPPLRAASARLKRSNACGRKSGGKPVALVGDASTTTPFDELASSRTVPAPCRSALSTRLSSACSRRRRSPTSSRLVGRGDVDRCALPTPHARSADARRRRAAREPRPRSARIASSPRPHARGRADPRPAARAARPPRRPSATRARARPAFAAGAPPARARSAGSRAASAARGSRRRRSGARARGRRRGGRASRSASPRGARSRRARAGAGAVARGCRPRSPRPGDASLRPGEAQHLRRGSRSPTRRGARSAATTSSCASSPSSASSRSSSGSPTTTMRSSTGIASKRNSAPATSTSATIEPARARSSCASESSAVSAAALLPATTEPSDSSTCASPSSPATTAEVTSKVDASSIGPRLERVGDPFVERVSEPDVEDRSDRSEHDRHHEREGERQPHPNREPAHATLSRRSRYPTPRTVSIELRANGRSILSRRYLTYTSTTFERFSYA